MEEPRLQLLRLTMSKRAERRAIREKLIERVKRIARDHWGGTEGRGPNWAQKTADHPNECKHECCKSPRKWAKGKERLKPNERREEE